MQSNENVPFSPNLDQLIAEYVDMLSGGFAAVGLAMLSGKFDAMLKSIAQEAGLEAEDVKAIATAANLVFMSTAKKSKAESFQTLEETYTKGKAKSGAEVDDLEASQVVAETLAVGYLILEANWQLKERNEQKKNSPKK